MTADDIQSPQALKAPIAVFQEIERRLVEITPDRYRRSGTVRSREMRALGTATDRMRQLYTLNGMLLDEARKLDRTLRLRGIEGNEAEFVQLNKTNMRQRIVALVLGLEVADAFSEYGVPFDIDEDGVVVAPRE